VGNVHATATVAADKPDGVSALPGDRWENGPGRRDEDRVHGRAGLSGAISIPAASYTPKDTWLVVITATAPA